MTNIDAFCDRLASVWKKNPDLRFGQLISIICSNNFIYDMKGRDIFFLSDDQMIDYIEDYFDGSN